jgi:feruloyl esterase
MRYRTILCGLALSVAGGQAEAAQSCESLASLQLANTTITKAEVVAEGAFVPPANPGSQQPPHPPSPNSPYAKLPAFCRIAATLRPSSDSEILTEVWLPLIGWNGNFHGIGNGAWSGAIGYAALAAAVARGYAAAGSDTGHEGSPDDASFANGHPEKLIDYGWRAVHEMTVKGKALMEAFYGSKARYSYWNACSSGGKQGLKEAQRFPEDYDGIVAGASAANWTHLMAGIIYTAQATQGSQGPIAKEKYTLLQRAVLESCDANDGVKDGVLENPKACHFNVASLRCKAGQAEGCLTAAEVEAMRKVYTGAKSSAGTLIYPGLEFGSEHKWHLASPGAQGGFFSIAETHFKNVVFPEQSKTWDFRTLNYDAHIALADRIDGGNITAMDPDISKFIARGGKLILYHGWTDSVIAPMNSVNYYQSVREKVGAADADKAVRLFMAPGLDHCSGGPGPNEFDLLPAIVDWVERGKAPESVVASLRKNDQVVRTRPLCPYPQLASYKGSGSTDDAANFTCKAP